MSMSGVAGSYDTELHAQVLTDMTIVNESRVAKPRVITGLNRARQLLVTIQLRQAISHAGCTCCEVYISIDSTRSKCTAICGTIIRLL